MTADEKLQNDILVEVDRYYTDKILTHGATPRGVDWNSAATQALRFEVLSTLLPHAGFSVADLGCGYGAYLDYLGAHRSRFDYLGVDISANMVEQARKLHDDKPRARFLRDSKPDVRHDHVVASGIFNVRQQVEDRAWLQYIHQTIDLMDSTSRFGFSFNCLTSHSDAGHKQPYLYYGDPSELFRHCMQYSRHVSLLHGYGLYEFTILVRKE